MLPYAGPYRFESLLRSELDALEKANIHSIMFSAEEYVMAVNPKEQPS